jgi:hypothetical protein
MVTQYFLNIFLLIIRMFIICSAVYTMIVLKTNKLINIFWSKNLIETNTLLPIITATMRLN